MRGENQRRQCKSGGNERVRTPSVPLCPLFYQRGDELQLTTRTSADVGRAH